MGWDDRPGTLIAPDQPYTTFVSVCIQLLEAMPRRYTQEVEIINMGTI